MIIHDGKAEIEIASLRDKNASLSKSMTQLGSALDDQTRENNRLTILISEKEKLNTELIEKLESEINQKKKIEKEVSSVKVNLAEATRSTREAENALTELTAEQARNLTQNRFWGFFIF